MICIQMVLFLVRSHVFNEFMNENIKTTIREWKILSKHQVAILVFSSSSFSFLLVGWFSVRLNIFYNKNMWICDDWRHNSYKVHVQEVLECEYQEDSGERNCCPNYLKRKSQLGKWKNQLKKWKKEIKNNHRRYVNVIRMAPTSRRMYKE